MRQCVIAVTLFLLASPAFAEPPKGADKDGIAWETNYDVAKARAQAEGKLLLIDVYTDS